MKVIRLLLLIVLIQTSAFVFGDYVIDTFDASPDSAGGIDVGYCSPAETFASDAVPNLTSYVQTITSGNTTIQVYPDTYCATLYRVPGVLGGYRRVVLHAETASAPYTPVTPASYYVQDGLLSLSVGADLPASLVIQYQGNHVPSFANCSDPPILCPQNVNDLGPYIVPGVDITEGGKDQAFSLMASADHPGTTFQITVYSASARGAANVAQQSKKRSFDDAEFNQQDDGEVMITTVKLSERQLEAIQTRSKSSRGTGDAVQYIIPFSRFGRVDFTDVRSVTLQIIRQVAVDAFMIDFRTIPLVQQTKTGVVVDSIATNGVAEPGERVNFSVKVSVIPNAVPVNNILFYDNPYLYDNFGTFDPNSVSVVGFLYTPVNCSNGTTGCVDSWTRDNAAFNGSFVRYTNGSLVYPNAIAFFSPTITSGSYLVFNYSIVINTMACALAACPTGCAFSTQSTYSAGTCICTRNTGYVCLQETNPTLTITQLNAALINNSLPANTTTALFTRCSPTTDVTSESFVTSLPVGTIPNPAVVIRSNPTDKANGLLPCASTTFTITLTNNRSRASDAFTLRLTPDANLVCGVGSGSSNPTFSLDSSNRPVRSFATGLPANASPVVISFVCNVSCSLGCGVNNTVLPAVIDFGSNTRLCPEDITADDTSSDNVPLIGAPSLSVTKSNAASITLGGSSNVASFTITVSNTGSRAATNIVVTDTVPAALAGVYQASDNNGWTSAGNNQYTFTIASIAANSQSQISFNYRIPTTAGDCVLNSYSNQVAVAGTCGGSASANATVNFVATPDVAVTMGTPTISPSSTNPAPNSLVCYPISYQNLGYRVATGITLNVVLPAITTFNATQSTSGWTRVGSTSNYTLSVSNLPAFTSGQTPSTVQFCVNVMTNVACGATMSSAVSVTAVCTGFPETNFANNAATSSVLTVSGSVVLSLTKSAFNSAGTAITSVAPGGTIVYRLSGTNTGTSQSTGVVLTESLPSGTTAGTNAGWTQSGSSYTYSVGTVAAGASFGPISFTVVAPSSVSCPAPVINNFATVTESCVGATSNASFSMPISASPVLGLTAPNVSAVVLASSNSVCVTACYTNTGNQIAVNSTMTLNVPQYATFVTPSNWVSSGSSLVYAIGSIAPGANICVPNACFTITSPIPCGVNSVTFNFALTSPCSTGSQNAVVVAPIIANPVFTISKTNNLAGADARPGQTVTYTITYANVGFRVADDVVLTENIPTYMTAGTNAGWTCSASSCTRSVGQLSPTAGSQSTTFVMVVSQNVPGRLSVNNTVNMQSTSCAAAASASSIISVAGFPNLVITKTDNGITVSPGEYIYYTIGYSNVGDTSADQVVINETVPAFTTFDAALSTPGWSCADGTGAGMQCVYTVGVLNRGSAGSVRFVVKLADWVRCGIPSTTNFATIQSLNPSVTETNYNDNSAVETTPIEGKPDLVIEKTTNRTQGARYERAGAGDSIVYNITYRNVGLRDATEAMIYETVPEYTTFDEENSSPNWNCSGTDAGSLCTLELDTVWPTMMGMDSTRVVQFAVRVVADLPPWAHVTTNCVEINNTCDDCNMFNNMACYPVTLYGVPDLTLNQTAYCKSIHWYVEWSNVGDQGATNVVITDTIPAENTFDSTRSDSRWSCDLNSNSLTYGQCTINVGSLNSGAGGSAVFVTNPIPGSALTTYTNRASASGTGNNPDPTPENNSDSATVGYEGCPDSCDSCCPTVDECCPDKTEVVFSFGGMLNGIDKCSSS